MKDGCRRVGFFCIFAENCAETRERTLHHFTIFMSEMNKNGGKTPFFARKTPENRFVMKIQNAGNQGFNIKNDARFCKCVFEMLFGGFSGLLGSVSVMFCCFWGYGSFIIFRC